MLASPAFAQNAPKPKAKPPAKPPTNQPVPSPAPAAPAAQPGKLPKPIEPGPYVRQTDLEYYSFKTMLHIYKSGETQSVEGTRLTFRYEIPFETMTLVFPMIPATSSATPRYGEANGLLELGGPAMIDGRFLPAGSPSPKGDYPRRPEILDKNFSGALYHSGISLAKFAVGEPKVTRSTTSVGFTIDLPMTTSNTLFDEERGLQVPWPKGPWPEVPGSTFQPQQWVDYEARPDGTLQRYDEGVFKALADRWLQGLDPQKDLTPAQTAKMLMGGLVRDIKPDRNILNYRLERPVATNNDTSLGGGTFLVGLQVRGAEYAARSPDGAGEWDVACLGAAVFRRCGLPTRIVVGYDRREEEEKEKGRPLKARVRAWIEFYLFDEANNTGNWVICDPYRLRKSMNQPPPLTQKWKYFGTHDEMSSMIPFAFHFVPPTDVRSYGAPAFWGWLVTPGMPMNADTAISFTARKTAVPSDRPANQDKPYGR
jgi:hypothetical protein